MKMKIVFIIMFSIIILKTNFLFSMKSYKNVPSVEELGILAERGIGTIKLESIPGYIALGILAQYEISPIIELDYVPETKLMKFYQKKKIPLIIKLKSFPELFELTELKGGGVNFTIEVDYVPDKELVKLYQEKKIPLIIRLKSFPGLSVVKALKECGVNFLGSKALEEYEDVTFVIQPYPCAI